MSDLIKRNTTSVVTSLKDKITNIRKNIDTCILADVSGSMDEYISPNERKIDALKSCLQDFKHIKLYEFSTNCHTVIELSSPDGSTALHRAFDVVKCDNIKKVILLTDGFPDNPKLALIAAKNLEINIIYIGPLPAPQFLADLAAKSGGTFSIEEIKDRKAITGKIKGYLST